MAGSRAGCAWLPARPSLTRLQSWPSTLLLARYLIDSACQAWSGNWYIFPLSLWGIPSPSLRGRGSGSEHRPTPGIPGPRLHDRKVSLEMNPAPAPNIQCFTSGLVSAPRDRESLHSFLLPGGGTVSADLHLPIPPRPALPGCGWDLASSPPCPSSSASPGVESPGARQACRCWAWEGGCFQAAGVCAKGGNPSLPAQSRSLLPVIPVSTLAGGTGNGGSGKGKEHLECGCRGKLEITG